MQYDETETTPSAGMLQHPTETADQPEPAERAPRPERPAGYTALWILTSVLTIITIVSLALNLLIVRQLVEARRLARLALGDSLALIRDLEAQTYSYNVVVDDTIIVNDDVPFQETIPVVIDETMPFSTAVTASVDVGPFGRYPVTIPIGGSIPVNLEFDVPVDESVPVYIEVPVHTEIPIEVTVANTPLYGTLVDAEAHLMELMTELERPLIWFLVPREAAGG
jgi:hypothetical protein